MKGIVWAAFIENNKTWGQDFHLLGGMKTFRQVGRLIKSLAVNVLVQLYIHSTESRWQRTTHVISNKDWKKFIKYFFHFCFFYKSSRWYKDIFSFYSTENIITKGYRVHFHANWTFTKSAYKGHSFISWRDDIFYVSNIGVLMEVNYFH